MSWAKTGGSGGQSRVTFPQVRWIKEFLFFCKQIYPGTYCKGVAYFEFCFKHSCCLISSASTLLSFLKLPIDGSCSFTASKSDSHVVVTASRAAKPRAELIMMETEQTTGSCPAPGQAAVRTWLSSSTRGTYTQPLMHVWTGSLTRVQLRGWTLSVKKWFLTF